MKLLQNLLGERRRVVPVIRITELGTEVQRDQVPFLLAKHMVPGYHDRKVGVVVGLQRKINNGLGGLRVRTGQKTDAGSVLHHVFEDQVIVRFVYDRRLHLVLLKDQVRQFPDRGLYAAGKKRSVNEAADIDRRQMMEVAARQRRKRMEGRNEQDQVLLKRDDMLDIRFFQLNAGAEGQIHGVIDDRLPEACGVLLFECDIDIGIALPEERKDSGDGNRAPQWRDADGDRFLVFTGEGGDHLVGSGFHGNNLSGGLQIDLSRGGRIQLLFMAQKELCT